MILDRVSQVLLEAEYQYVRYKEMQERWEREEEVRERKRKEIDAMLERLRNWKTGGKGKKEFERESVKK